MKEGSQEKEKKQRNNATVNAGLAGIADDVVDRYGSGVKEHIVGYTGTDNEHFLDLETGKLKPWQMHVKIKEMFKHLS